MISAFARKLSRLFQNSSKSTSWPNPSPSEPNAQGNESSARTRTATTDRNNQTRDEHEIALSSGSETISKGDNQEHATVAAVQFGNNSAPQTRSDLMTDGFLGGNKTVTSVANESNATPTTPLPVKIEAALGPTLTMTAIRERAGVLRGLPKGQTPQIDGVKFTYSSMDCGWTFSRSKWEVIAKHFDIRQQVEEELDPLSSEHDFSENASEPSMRPLPNEEKQTIPPKASKTPNFFEKQVSHSFACHQPIETDVAKDTDDQATIERLEQALEEESGDAVLYYGRSSQFKPEQEAREPLSPNRSSTHKPIQPNVSIRDDGYTVKPLPNDLKIRDLIADGNCSVRLFNSISNAKDLPIETVWEYMQNPERSLEIFRPKVRNLGRKSALELHELISKTYLSLVGCNRNRATDDLDQNAIEYDERTKLAISVARRLIEGLSFPGDILDAFPSTRLKNLLTNNYVGVAIPLSDLLGSYEQFLAQMIKNENCGAKTLKELDRLIDDLISSRLSNLGMREDLASTTKRILAGRHANNNELEEIIALEGLDASFFSSKDVVSKWGATISEIVPRVLGELNNREREIITRRYGLAGSEAETLEQISLDQGVTRQRISQIEVKGLRKIRNRRIVKSLAAALDVEDAIETVFENRKIITDDQISSISKNLRPELRLAVDICYEGLAKFLEQESVKVESGWTLERYLLELPEEPDIFLGSLRQRLVDAILNGSLPIRVSLIAEMFPDISLEEIKAEIEASFAAEIDGDEVRAAPRLPTYVRYILILRKAGHSLHCKEVRALNHEIFGKDESIQQIGSVLGGLEEALIVARGTYNLYENLRLSSEELQTIRETVHESLKAREQFVSVKILFSDIFQGSTEKYGTEFDYYMLLGILQDDERFDVRRGLMVGLVSFSEIHGFLSLNEEIIAVLNESSLAMSLEEIAEALEGRRDTSPTSIATSLENSPQAVSVGRGHYDLISRVFGDQKRQEQLHDFCCLVLFSGPKSVLALAELVSPIFGEYHTRPLKGFLSTFEAFEVKGDLIFLKQAPAYISKYLEVRDAAMSQAVEGADDVSNIRDYLARHNARDFTELDPAFAHPLGTEREASGEDELIDKLLDDFGI